MASQPAYRVQGSSELQKGDAEQLAAELSFAENMGPSTPAELPAPQDQGELGTGVDFGQVYGEVADPAADEVLFSPSDRPGEPITQGASFGEGADFLPLPHEEQDQYMSRVARRVIEAGPAMPDSGISWALRQLLGE